MSENADPTIGRIVHYRKGPDGPCQAAIVVKVWSKGTVNLQIFRDGTNDNGIDGLGDAPMAWQTSAMFDDGSGKSHTWHWPEREAKEETP